MANNTIDLKQLDAKKARATKSDSYFGKGITLAAGFDLGAKSALDSRSVCKTISERDEHVTGNRAYEGMLVYVEETKITYQYTGTDWREFGFNSNDFESGIVNDLTTGGVDKALSAQMGKVLNEKLTEQADQLTVIDGKVDAVDAKADTIIESIEGLEQDLSTGLDNLNNKIDGNTTAIAAEVQRATKAEEALQAAIDLETDRAEAAELAITSRLDKLEGAEGVEGSVAHSIKEAKTELETKINELGTTTTQAIATAKTEAISEAKAYTDAEIAKVTTASNELTKKVTALEEKDVELETAIRAVDTKADANSAAIQKEKTDREAAITTVTSEINRVAQDLATEAANREQADETLQTNIDAVDAKVDALQGIVDGIETTWDAVTGKPFEVLGNTLEVSTGKELNVKTDGVTIEASANGAIKVKDGVFALHGHNHDDQYASKAHEENEGIHLTVDEKANVGKIPTIENDVNLLKTTVGAASTHIIVNTKAELAGLIDTCNHATIAHVIETNETYILEKDSDINGNQITPEWIKLSDADALVSVDWGVVNNKPFSTVAEGLTVADDKLTVAVDGTTIELANGKVAVKDGVFAEADHTHVVDFADVINKPVAFKQSYTQDNFVDGAGLDEGLFSLDVQHNKNSKNLKVTVVGNDNIERFVAIEYTDNNNIKIWSDEKESVTVTVNSLDYATTTTIDTVTKAIVGQAKVGEARL